MTDAAYTPAPIRTILSLEAPKVVADPLRGQIMELLIPGPKTIGAVAEMLGHTPNKMYYHFGLLEKHGFIQVVDTTVHGNIIEKHYWLTAYDFELDKELLNFNVDTPEGKDTLITMFLTNIEITREDLIRSMEARHTQMLAGAQRNPRPVFDFRHVFNISDERASEFHQRLYDLVQEFKTESEAAAGDPGTPPYAMTIVMYPSFYYQQMQEENNE